MFADARAYLRDLRVVWRSAPIAAAISGILVVLQAVQANAFTIVSGLLVGSIPGAIAHGLTSSDGSRMLILLAVAAVVQGLQMIVFAPLQQFLMVFMEQGLTAETGRHLMETGLGPGGLAHLENPTYQDRAAMATGEGLRAPRMTSAYMVVMALSWLTQIGAAIILFRYIWWAPLVLAAAVYVERRWSRADVTLHFDQAVGNVQDLRRAAYYRDLALEPSAAKEIRAFGLGSFLVERMIGHSRRAFAAVWRRRGESSRLLVIATLVMIFAHLVVYGAVAWEGVRGLLGLGAMAICAQAIQGTMNFGAMWGEMRWRFSSQALQASQALAAAVPDEARISGSLDADGLPRRAIRFEAVRFGYPGATGQVFSSLDLDIQAGSSTAIVGRNGVGKTTLIKLLARLYQPQGGRITVDGLDLAQIAPAAWRSRLAVVFQDFVRYELPIRDNVGFGALGLADDQRALETAVRRAGAAGLIESLPRGWETVLSPGYSGGVDLSGGQWQRVALARAMLAAERGGVLVLDEPTASLDVRAEAELFDSFLELTRGLTTILITHRFSSVRHADRIVVMEHGQVIEAGSHDQLMSAGGTYAEMFRLQAMRFQE
ncbi:MAG TPA: ABC transporter ATP-binding protein [Candidatus Dormibacteraeota bacterium]|jgi:ATP-binding cassette subfamily B protein|nr:ABC transporter ATP-binding protein [Candidatus Dormibacteraeota bacterium]